jgi:hypothetical protein
VIQQTRTFAGEIYPRRAVESAAVTMRDVCDVRIDDEKGGVRVTLDLPDAGAADLLHEFSNLALIAAIEEHLEGGR